MPKTRIEFWQKKFNENLRRDKETYQMLSESGFKVFVIWECEITEAYLNNICLQIKGSQA
jgi:DNA mismatch endonuclease (patch repair protein)